MPIPHKHLVLNLKKRQFGGIPIGADRTPCPGKYCPQIKSLLPIRVRPTSALIYNEAIGRPLDLFDPTAPAERDRRVLEILDMVQLPPCGYRKSYPGWRRCRDGLSSLWDA